MRRVIRWLVVAAVVSVVVAGTPSRSAARGRDTFLFLPLAQAVTTGVRGAIVDVPDWWPPGATVTVWLAWYWPLGPGGDSGMWVLDPSQCPQGQLEPNGRFFVRAKPGRYCVVIGWEPYYARALTNVHGRAEVFNVAAGKVLDIGTRPLS